MSPMHTVAWLLPGTPKLRCLQEVWRRDTVALVLQLGFEGPRNWHFHQPKGPNRCPLGYMLIEFLLGYDKVGYKVPFTTPPVGMPDIGIKAAMDEVTTTFLMVGTLAAAFSKAVVPFTAGGKYVCLSVPWGRGDAR